MVRSLLRYQVLKPASAERQATFVLQWGSLSPGLYASAGFTTKLSSAGLVYKHYGRQIIAQMMGKQEDDPAVEAVYLRVYKNFMEAIDGIDNGAEPCVWAPASHASKSKA